MSKGASHEELIVSAAAVAVAANDGAPAPMIRLLPAGQVKLKDGRGPYMVDPAAVVEATRAYWGGEMMPLDYDHQTLATKDGKGGKAPASGWIDPAKLEARADGVWGPPEWTPAAAQHITAKEYRYFSPLFGALNGPVTKLYGGGLTNDPAIGGLTAIAASRFHPQKEPDEMDLSKLALSLGLPADATLDQIMAAQTLQAERLQAASAALGVTPAATTEEITAAASKLKPDPKKIAGEGELVVPASAWNDTQQRLAQLEDAKIVAIVDQGMADGKFVPASRESMLAWAKKDLPAFEGYLKTAPSIVAAGRQLTGKPGEGDPAAGLTTEELQAASAMGLSAEDYAKNKGA